MFYHITHFLRQPSIPLQWLYSLHIIHSVFTPFSIFADTWIIDTPGIMAVLQRKNSPEGSDLAARRSRRDARPRPWLTGSAEHQRRPTSSTSPAMKVFDEAVSEAALGKERRMEEVPSVPVRPRAAADSRMVVRHHRETAYACGSRLPRLATPSSSARPSAQVTVGKAGSTASAVRTVPSAPTSRTRILASRAVGATWYCGLNG